MKYMIPQNNLNNALMTLEAEEMPTLTHRVDFERKKVIGKCDGLEAIKQLVYIILNVERFDWVIFSPDFGVEFKNLFGMPVPYVLPEIKRRITEALMQDDRITDVTNYDFTVDKSKIHCKFKVHSVFGNFEQETEVVV